MKPKVIVIVDGGAIQQVIANTEIEFVNLDWDILDGDSVPDFDEDYEGRHYGSNVDVYGPRKFKKTEAELKKEWDDKLNAIIRGAPDDGLYHTRKQFENQPDQI